jgi:PKD domain
VNFENTPPANCERARHVCALSSSLVFRLLIAILFVLMGLPLMTAKAYAQMGPQAQMGPEAGSELNGPGPMASPSPSTSEVPPVQNLHIPQPVHGSMIVTPPFGSAPLRVGFFVLATDPEGLGFLTYSWNFGDGTVSSLPPELYIFHTYQNPGSYVCELTTTTVDGRKNSFFQGVIVGPALAQ